MPYSLIDLRMYDGSRQFLSLPASKSIFWVRCWLLLLPRARLTTYISSLSESWLDFSCQHHEFTINNQFGEFWFFVADPNCPEAVLTRVAEHFARLLPPKNTL